MESEPPRGDGFAFRLEYAAEVFYRPQVLLVVEVAAGGRLRASKGLMAAGVG